jgi:hypothetical protein
LYRTLLGSTLVALCFVPLVARFDTPDNRGMVIPAQERPKNRTVEGKCDRTMLDAN